ncbi:MAG TPA: glycoside hydrolase family 9 protein [Sphingomicrobium sp.]|jgi:endoglucanase
MISTLLLAAAAGQVAAPNPVRINQLGFQPGQAHRAITANTSPQPVPWRLLNRSGRAVSSGLSTVFGNDPQSGEKVHRIDFAAPEGAGYRLKVGNAISRSFAVSPAIYDRLRYDSLNYFYQNRAGAPIEARFAGGAEWARPAGHLPEKAGCVSGEDAQGNVWPGCAYTLDVTGGWYDAGDQGKYIVNGGISLWTLLNLYEREQGRADKQFADGRVAIPEAGNGINDLLDEARWEVEFFLKMQVPEGTRLRLPTGVKRSVPGLSFREIDGSGMVHHKVADERWTPLPTPPHLDKERRILFPPSTAATLNFAATMAQCARIWSAIDAALSGRCLQASERAWAAAVRNPEVYAIAGFTGSGGYGDGELVDEFYWAAAELFATTGKAAYSSAVRRSPLFTRTQSAEFSWGDVGTLGTITLATVASDLPASDRQRLRSSLVAAADSYLKDSERTGYALPYGPANWPWGSTSSILNRGIVLALANDFTGAAKYRRGVTDAMDFILGRNALDQSFVSGYGARPMRNPHHRFWANQLDPKVPGPPPGALSGGPNTGLSDPTAAALKGRCAPQTCWLDDARSYSLNEVAINWNAPLVWVTSWLSARG